MNKFPKNKLQILIFGIILFIFLTITIVFQWMNILSDYIFLIAPTFGSVYLVYYAGFNEEYASYFRKHRLVYEVILAVAFLLLIIALIVRPAFYLVTILIGLYGFDFTLAILLAVVYDQNKLNQKKSNH
jgi:hypothetical protein